MEGYPREASAGFSAHSKNTFYSKKASHKQDYMELWEERRYEREVQREKLDAVMSVLDSYENKSEIIEESKKSREGIQQRTDI